MVNGGSLMVKLRCSCRVVLGIAAAMLVASSVIFTSPEPAESEPKSSVVSGQDSLRTHFGTFLHEFFGRLTIPPSLEGQVVRELSPSAAILDRAGQRSIVEGTEPINGINDGLIDLRMTSTPKGFSPNNPATPVEFPHSLNAPIELSDTGARLSLTGASADATAEPFAFSPDGSPHSVAAVWYQNAYPDADLLVAPLPTGAELFAHVRSEDSQHSFPLDFELPPGVALSEAEGVIRIVEDDKIRGTITAPFAIDALGDEIPVELALHGSRVTFGVSEQLRPDQYPVLIDPVIDWWNWYTGNNTNFEGWLSSQSGSSQYEMTTFCNSAITDSCASSGTGTGRGLYVNARPGRTFAASSQGRWNYTVPGTDSYISEAVIHSWRYRKGSHSAMHPFGFFGLSTGAAWTNLFWTDVGGGGTHTLSGGTTSKVFSTGLSSHNNVTFPTGNANWRFMRVAAVNLSIEDESAPYLFTIDTSSIPSGWSNSTATVHVPYFGWDNGLGVQSAIGRAPSRTGGTYRTEKEYPCDGTAAARCPAAVNGLVPPSSHGLSFDLSKVLDGPQTASVVLTDPLDKGSTTKTFDLKLDRDGPSVLFSGSLWKRRGATIGSKVHHLQIDTTDGTPEEPRSGVKEVRVIIDGVPDPLPSTQTCPSGSCSLDRQVVVDPLTLGAGSHTIRVEAEDQIGNVTASQFSFEVNADDECADMEEDEETLCEIDQGNVYFATVWNEQPSSGGTILGTEIVQPTTLSARAVNGDGSIHTRGIVECGTGLCAEVRSSTPSIEQSGHYDWITITGDSADDPDLESVSQTLRPFEEGIGSLIGTQPLRNVIRSWQAAPPGVAGTVNVYQRNGDDAVNDGHLWDRWFVDQATGLPIRHSYATDIGDGPQHFHDYFTYASWIWKVGDLSASTFVQDPRTPLAESETYSDNDWDEDIPIPVVEPGTL